MYPPYPHVAVRRLQLDAATNTLVVAPKKEPFLRGPIPLGWVTAAASLPGKTINVALALWWRQFLAPYALRLAGFAAILGAVGAVLFGARQAGRNAERVQQMRKTIEVQRDQLEAAARRPRDRDELISRMRDGSF